MPFVESDFFVERKMSAFLALMREFNLSQKEAQKALDKGRLCAESGIIKKGQKIQGAFRFSHFVPENVGIAPLFENESFAIFDKPHNMPTHPKGRFIHASLNDAAKFLFGNSANPCHRLDTATSGLVLVAKNKMVERELKALFELKKVKKIYLARVAGKAFAQTINAPILTRKMLLKKRLDSTQNIKIKSKIDAQGQSATTIIAPLFYDAMKNESVVKLTPFTGRTHQLRIHLASVGHRILGDGLYGVDDATADLYLTGRLSLAERVKFLGSPNLALNAYYLSFTYQNRFYEFTSKIGLNDAQK